MSIGGSLSLSVNSYEIPHVLLLIIHCQKCFINNQCIITEKITCCFYCYYYVWNITNNSILQNMGNG